jgi:thiol-disulfide isomerase/thioredoxin
LKPHVDIPVGSHPWSACVVNFDADMKPDLLVAVTGNTRISWVHGAPKMGWALGDTIPAFAAKNQYDETYSQSSMLGKWTLLDFCSSWCLPCRQYMAPVTQDAWLDWYRHPSVSFEYVTALIDGNVPGTASTRQDAIDWSQEYGIFRPVLHSGDLPGAGARVAAQDAENYWTPTTRLIDPAGRVVWMGTGAVAETTIARLVANAAGVAIPLTEMAAFYSGTETVTYGAQQVSVPSDPSSGFTWPYAVTGFGENFTSDLFMMRHAETLTEDWLLNLIYYPLDAVHGSFPTANSWQITVSNLQLDPGARILPPGTMATVVATDTFGVDHVLPAPVSVSWAGGALTFGAIPSAALAALPPIRMLALSLTMQTPGWVAGVDDGPIAAELAMRTPSPNPAQSTSRIAWSQPRAAAARLEVYDVRGARIRTLANGVEAAGAHAATWNLADASGARVGAGLYFVRLSVAGENARVQRVTVVR